MNRHEASEKGTLIGTVPEGGVISVHMPYILPIKSGRGWHIFGSDEPVRHYKAAPVNEYLVVPGGSTNHRPDPNSFWFKTQEGWQTFAKNEGSNPFIGFSPFVQQGNLYLCDVLSGAEWAHIGRQPDTSGHKPAYTYGLSQYRSIPDSARLETIFAVSGGALAKTADFSRREVTLDVLSSQGQVLGTYTVVRPDKR